MTVPSETIQALIEQLSQVEHFLLHSTPTTRAELFESNAKVCHDISDQLSSLLAGMTERIPQQEEETDLTRSGGSVDLPASVSTHPPTGKA